MLCEKVLINVTMQTLFISIFYFFNPLSKCSFYWLLATNSANSQVITFKMILKLLTRKVYKRLFVAVTNHPPPLPPFLPNPPHHHQIKVNSFLEGFIISMATWVRLREWDINLEFGFRNRTM